MKPLLQQAGRLQEILVARATGSWEDDHVAEYFQLREALLAGPSVANLVPAFVQKYRSLDQFWPFIKHKFGSYQERREFIWDEFQSLLDALERRTVYPVDTSIESRLERFDSASVHAVWSRALERRTADPAGAITMARTLVETVCKHILDESGAAYSEKEDLPKLYKLVATELSLAPSQHSEQIFKQILGGCTAVVEGLGSIRNKLGDAHGKGKRPVRAAPRHAELAVNLAGAMAAFLVATWEVRSEIQT